MGTVKGRTDDAIQFLRSWAKEGPWVLTSIIPDGGRTTTITFQANQKKELKEWIEERQGRQNIYFTVNSTTRPVSSKPKKTDIRGMRAIHVDVDPRVGEELSSERKRALKVLKEFDPKPTVIIDSGGGYQGFWLLDQELTIDGDEERAAELEAYNLQVEVILQADACHNIDRIMRLPGTINVPGEKKRKKGRKEALAKVVDADWKRKYPIASFTAAPRVQTPGSGGHQVKLSGNLPRLDSIDDLPDKVTHRTKMLIVNGDDPDDPTKYPSRSEALFAVLCELVRAEIDDDMIAACILDPDFGISAHVLEQSRPQQYAARQIQRAREEAIDPWLLKLNDRHSVIEDIGGKCRVVSEVMDYALGRKRISRQSFDDFRNRYMNHSIVIGKDKKGDVKVPLGNWWLMHPNRRQYTTMVFAPGKEVKDAYNLWRGFACEAKPGDCSMLLEHIKENVCRNNETHYEYYMNWMARAVQKPASPGEVAIVMRGRMGTGKGFAIKAFGSLWGRHFVQVTDSKHLVGSFNDHFRDCVVLFGDEAFYAGDKKHEAILKTMVTEETLMIEGKGVNAEATLNCIHLMMASNSDWVVPAGMDERRFFVIDVGDERFQDKKHFRKMREELNNGGREALLYLLMNRDISDFEVRDFPKTEALRDQKLLSMSPEEQWWFTKLEEGRLLTDKDGWPVEVPKSDIQADYIRYADRQKIMRRASPTALGKFLKRVMPGSMPKAYQKIAEVSNPDNFGGKTSERVKMWFYEVSSLEECRAQWDSLFGSPYAWPDVKEIEPSEDWEETDEIPF